MATALGIVTHTIPLINWTTGQLMPSGDYSLRTAIGATQYALTEIGSTGIYTVDSSMTTNTVYIIYENVGNVSKKLSDATTEEAYLYQNPDTLLGDY